MRRSRSSVRPRRTTIVGVIAAVALAAGCASDESSDGTADVTTAPRSTAASSTSESPTTTPMSEPLWGPPGSEALPAETTAAMQGALDDAVARGDVVGVTAALVTLDGTWVGAAGDDSAGTALEPDSVLSLQSVSKTFTAAEVMALVEQGLVDLDAPVVEYVDLPFETDGATVRQVLSMRSGFPSADLEQRQIELAGDLDRVWTFDESMTAIADGPRLGTLGGEPRYNDVNYKVLAAVVEEVTDGSFAAAVRHDLLEPAGLTHTWVQPTETPSGPLAVGGRAMYADLVDSDGPYLPSMSFDSDSIGAGSVAADATDAAVWGFELLGGQVIDAASIAEMEADPQTDPAVGDYGLGLMLGADDRGEPIIGHVGGGPEWTYTTLVEVWPGAEPVALSILVPEAVDFGGVLFPLFMALHEAFDPAA